MSRLESMPRRRNYADEMTEIFQRHLCLTLLSQSPEHVREAFRKSFNDRYIPGYMLATCIDFLNDELLRDLLYSTKPSIILTPEQYKEFLANQEKLK